jgi:hypothetical protein
MDHLSTLRSDSDVDDGFGQAVALNEDFLIIGAPFDDATGGLVYAFSLDTTSNENTSISEYQVISPLSLRRGSSFGASISLHEETLVVGAPRYSSNTDSLCGVVYVFDFDAFNKRFNFFIYALFLLFFLNRK